YDYDAATNTTTLLREYVWLDGVPVAMVDGATDAVYLIRTDHIGRPIFATDTSGVKVWEASYLPFGGVHVSTGATSDLRFPGQWFQSESGLHQNWMREYDPTTGRYIQADPLGLVAGVSVYGYALQNPGRFVDPNGENPVGWGIRFAVKKIGNLLKRTPAQKKKYPRRKGDRKIEEPKKIPNMWHCKCRADFAERYEDCPPDQKPFSFGSAANKNRGMARQAAEKLAKENLGAKVVHHISCTCKGPKGEVWRRGG
ncbi:RHS repeat-associated core domain-containing protein, partial [Sulfitobacter sp. HNIBRBA2951]|uniref:RHS repeat domain-containing protein n=1 Tax=Sulfitobacter aquimarinus TaxID=3158557 RepID=UPI0032DFCBA8